MSHTDGHTAPVAHRRHFRRGPARALLPSAALLMFLAGCGEEEKVDNRPNVLWVVWDTVRADRLSLYGHEPPTTPYLREFAARARVYEDCMSVSSTTVPSHASMFTGLMPSEHGLDNMERNLLHDDFTTIAELLGRSGYRTYLFAANPFISETYNFDQGFDRAEGPYSSKYAERALEIVRRKVPPQDHSSELRYQIAAGRSMADKGMDWAIKSTGELAREGVAEWLEDSDAGRPYFIFLNYMEAHRPYIPPEKYRHRFMTPEQVETSYTVDRSWPTMWAYTFGLHEYTPEELKLTAATYDAALAELDDLFRNLLAALEARGLLDNTLVILTADHGEHLGEHHLLDHQYSVYQPLLHVPLLVHYPERFAPGRDRRPVMNLDLFATVLEVAGVDPPGGLPQRGVSLLSPLEERERIAEYPRATTRPFPEVMRRHPGWDPAPWQRSLRALRDGRFKYIAASDGRDELYDLLSDPEEGVNLLRFDETTAAEMAGALNAAVADFHPFLTSSTGSATLSEAQRRRLGSLGYIDEATAPDAGPQPASQPGTPPPGP